jgi:hypothetical protein
MLVHLLTSLESQEMRPLIDLDLDLLTALSKARVSTYENLAERSDKSVPYEQAYIPPCNVFDPTVRYGPITR